MRSSTTAIIRSYEHHAPTPLQVPPGHGHRAAIGGGDPGLPPQPRLGGDVVPCHHRPRRRQPRGDHVPLRFEGAAGRSRPRRRARGLDAPGARAPRPTRRSGHEAPRCGERAQCNFRRAARSTPSVARGLRPRRARSRSRQPGERDLERTRRSPGGRDCRAPFPRGGAVLGARPTRWQRSSSPSPPAPS